MHVSFQNTPNYTQFQSTVEWSHNFYVSLLPVKQCKPKISQRFCNIKIEIVNSARGMRKGAKTKLSANSVKKFRICRLCLGSAGNFHQQPITGSVCCV
jgi:hypothetical protein